MPHRVLVARELADLLGVLAHPHRIRIVEELRDGERDVKSLQAALGISHPGVSQHLMLLRAHRLVSERRQGRQVFYHLTHPNLAAWLTEAMRFLEEERVVTQQLRKAIKKARAAWAADEETA
jgi:DNA-binding transcriptional ArsR family regulator